MIISVHELQHAMGAKHLFEGLSFGIDHGEKTGLIGPNGAGKSTLMKILAQRLAPDAGAVAHSNDCKVEYVPQERDFSESVGLTSYEYLMRIVGEELPHFGELEAEVKVRHALSQAGFLDVNIQISALSGGWKKRLSILKAVVLDPDLILFDEPTNHLDWEGIFWLEGIMKRVVPAFFVISHDRAFLNSVVDKVMEINPVYHQGFLSAKGNYDQFLNERFAYWSKLQEEQATLKNKLKKEVDWLRRSPSARTTKSRSRIERAHNMMDSYDDVKRRTQLVSKKVDISFSETEKKSKKIISLSKVTHSYDDKPILKDVDYEILKKQRLGVLGRNGTGKTTLLKILAKQMTPTAGDVVWAENLSIHYFDQRKESLNLNNTLKEELSGDGDYVDYQGAPVHVASYARKFLFDGNHLNLKVEQLSGGEKARLLIAKLMQIQADVLILDEPTNDLDIDTLEVFEEALSGFGGVIVLVSHDRYFLDQICDHLIAISHSNLEIFADFNQWKSFFTKSGRKKAKVVHNDIESEKAKADTRKLSYKEKKHHEVIEKEIEVAEQLLEELTLKLQDPQISADHALLAETSKEIELQQKCVDELYTKWNYYEEVTSK